MSGPAPERFVISVPEDVLRDLHHRLSTARIVPNEIENAGHDPNGSWAYGTDKRTLQAFVNHWLEHYNWREHEARLNSFDNFTVPVHGLRMHFIHQRSMDPDAIPLLLVHGWPGSIVEFLRLIPLLTSSGFHVVAPSIPGYGWSEAPTKHGANVSFMASQVHQLMLQLGYCQYVAQGGDWGSMICSNVAARYPQHCVALHINMCVPAIPRDWYGLLKLATGMFCMSSGERSGLASTMYFLKFETAYQQIQGTKPQSLAYGLNDSPVGLLAWILEKFQSWSDCGQGDPLQSGLSKDDILTDVMVYWVTQTIASSIRIYYETLSHQPRAKNWLPSGLPTYVPVPTGVLIAHTEIIKPPKHWANLAFNLKHWSLQQKGGHFFAFEQPQLMADELVHYFHSVINFHDCKKSPPRPGQGRPFEPGRYVLLALMCLIGASAANQLKSHL